MKKIEKGVKQLKKSKVKIIFGPKTLKIHVCKEYFSTLNDDFEQHFAKM